MKDIDTFSLSQATSNESGKTSASGTAGLYIIFIGGIIAIVATIGWLMKLAGYETVFLFVTGIIGTGAGLLGFRKSKDNTTTYTTGPDPK